MLGQAGSVLFGVVAIAGLLAVIVPAVRNPPRHHASEDLAGIVGASVGITAALMFLFSDGGYSFPQTMLAIGLAVAFGGLLGAWSGALIAICLSGLIEWIEEAYRESWIAFRVRLFRINRRTRTSRVERFAEWRLRRTHRSLYPPGTHARSRRPPGQPPE